MLKSEPIHLDIGSRVIQGSYYTPARYVAMVGEWLRPLVGDGAEHTIMDPSCGYGAFFALQPGFPRARWIGNDIDREAVEVVRREFPEVVTRTVDTFRHLTRKDYGISGRLVIVGNPPYNDTTSQNAQGIKRGCAGELRKGMSPRVASRDLGISSLLVYECLKADYVAVLHPLSYLIKAANFKLAKAFFAHYRLEKHIVFNSQEFAGTSRSEGFPVIVALYRRSPKAGLTYEQVREVPFQTVEGRRFRLADFSFVTEKVDKYPQRGKNSPPAEASEIFFYTLRDMNALKRSKTFLTAAMANAVRITSGQLPYYCYIDCFKRYAEVPYYLGNLDVPYLPGSFGDIAALCLRDAACHHPEVFGDGARPLAPEEAQRLRESIDDALKCEMVSCSP